MKTFLSLLVGVISLFESSAVAIPTAVSTLADRSSAGPVGSEIACKSLASLQPDALFEEDSQIYHNQTALVWSQTCLAEPKCVFLPRSARHLADGLRIMRGARVPFTVRAGGHMPVPGAQESDDSILVSLSALNGRELSPDKSIARIGPGQVWSDVYNWIAPYGLAVNGGRYGSVGVGGVLLGGGIGYFASRKGWAADGVVGYEVVLPDSRVVYATKTAYPDLFWALKGGSNNFGIVTRFDVQTFTAGPAWAGAAIWKRESLPAFFQAAVSYMAPGGGVEDADAAISMIIAATPSDEVVESIFLGFRSGRDVSPKSFENFTAINAPSLVHDFGPRDSWTFLANALNTPEFASRNLRQLFYSVSFKADARTFALVNETVITASLTGLKDVTNCAITLTYQPVSKAWLEASRAAGGNPIDLDPGKGTFIAGLISTSWTNPADDAKVLEFSRKAGKSILAQTKKLGLDYPYIYLNDASPGQDPYPTYGKDGSSLKRLKDIQRKYDPDGTLNRLLGKPFPLR
ncbi:FAD-binding domain-containing protein [Pseudovirgaria hyperparasitica]|uniref:FAD-binding domain-containing protein n=1 Tax=Pseudovirgaria hyperparasitica TaxID=470096 RepID=A0A6A6VUZ7_9PEZI|nr:FAD-binding domain-containing protein [Pseudovirgaria hyperparasitica]KAF2753071.1 FAD-binding domain-containing protein [Pseudovirgaria hyperparasitica]